MFLTKSACHASGGPGRGARGAARQKLFREEGPLPRVGRDEAYWYTVGGIGAAEEVLDEQLGLLVQVTLDRGEQLGEVRLGELLVPPPPDLAGGAGLLHHELVLGTAAGVGRRDRGEGAAVAQLPLVPPHRVLDEPARREVGPHALGRQAVGGERI